MRIPKALNVSGYDLKIKYAKKVVVNGDECFGIYDKSNRTITLVKGMSPARKKEVFIHEYFHFLEDIYRIKISHESLGIMALGVLKLITEVDFN